MENAKSQCICEQCGRLSELVDVQPLTVAGYTTYLCITCTYILSQEGKREHLLAITKQKNVDESNGQMKKVHHLLSSLILVGILLLVSIIGFRVGQNTDDLISEKKEEVKQKEEDLAWSIKFIQDK